MAPDSSTDVKYDFTPYDGTPGVLFEKFEQNLFNSASEGDKRGYSLADHLLDVDEGGAAPGAGPAIAGLPAAQFREADAARRNRARNSYKLITRHLVNDSHLAYIKANFFQDGRATWLYLETQCRTQMSRLRLQQLEGEWLELDLLADAGVNENSVNIMATRIRACNAKRPAANQKTPTEMGDRLLELIFGCSKHFHSEATAEYNAAHDRRSDPQ